MVTVKHEQTLDHEPLPVNEIAVPDFIQTVLHSSDIVNAKISTNPKFPHTGLMSDELRLLLPTVDLTTLPEEVVCAESFSIFFNPETTEKWIQFTFYFGFNGVFNLDDWLNLVDPFLQSCVGIVNNEQIDPFDTSANDHRLVLRLSLQDCYE